MTKQTKPILHEVCIPTINPFWVFVIWGDDVKTLKYLRKHFEDDTIEIDGIREIWNARTYNNPTHNPVILMAVDPKSDKWWGSLSHEAVHAIEKIWGHMGEKSHDEAFAYCVGMITQDVQEYLKKKHV